MGEEYPKEISRKLLWTIIIGVVAIEWLNWPRPWDSRTPSIKNSWYVDFENGVDGWCLEDFLKIKD